MTDAEQTIAALHEKLHAASKRANELAGKRRKLAFAVHAVGDKAASAQLNALNAESATLTADLENIRAALQEGEARLTAARNAVARDAEEEHARNAVAILEDLVALGPKLDELVPHPRPEDNYGVALYCQNDPPTCCQAAKLVSDLVEHLRALRLTEASFPKFWSGVGNKFDLEKELMKTISAGWPRIAVEVAPRQRTTVMPGQPLRTPQFTKILTGWAAVIRKTLVQQEKADAA